MVMSTLALEKKQGIVVDWQRVLQTATSLRVFSLVFRAPDLLNITNTNPQQENQIFTMEKLVPANVSFYESFNL